MSSLWKCVITFVITAILASGVWFFVMHMRTEKITEEFEGEIAQLTATLDALGPGVECYTVSEEFSYHYDYDTVGQVLTAEAITPITVPSSLVGEAYITDTSQIIGKYCKVNIVPGTPITGDLLMSEWFDDTLRDVDITVNSRVVGMRVGDYVDIRITLPFGEDYVIFPHKRIQYIGDRSIKVYLNEEEWHLWQSATVDYYLNSQYGCRIYLTKYIEPGVQQAAVSYYAPSDRVYEIMRKDPNVVTEALTQMGVLHNNRGDLDELFNEFVDETRDTTQTQGGLLSGGRSSWSSDVLTDYRTKQQTDEANKQGDEEDTYTEGEEVQVSLETEGEETVASGESTEQNNAPITETQGVAGGSEVQGVLGAETETTEAAGGAVPAGQVGVPAGAESQEETTVAQEFESPAAIEETVETTEGGLEDPDFVG